MVFSCLGQTTHEVRVRRKLIDTSYLESSISATNKPPFLSSAKCAEHCSIAARQVTGIKEQPSRIVVRLGRPTSAPPRLARSIGLQYIFRAISHLEGLFISATPCRLQAGRLINLTVLFLRFLCRPARPCTRRAQGIHLLLQQEALDFLTEAAPKASRRSSVSDQRISSFDVEIQWAALRQRTPSRQALGQVRAGPRLRRTQAELAPARQEAPARSHQAALTCSRPAESGTNSNERRCAHGQRPPLEARVRPPWP